MATIVIPSTQLFLFVAGRRITNFPSTGTYISIEKDTQNSTPVSGQHDTLTHVANIDRLHRMTVTVMQGHPDDSYLSAAIIAQEASASVIPVSLTYFGVSYNSVNCRISQRPTREIAADGIPNMAYVLAGTFPEIVIAQFVEPPQLTEEEIASFQP